MATCIIIPCVPPQNQIWSIIYFEAIWAKLPIIADVLFFDLSSWQILFSLHRSDYLPYSPMWRHRHLFQSLKVFITTKCCKGYIWYIVRKHFVILYIICYSSWFPKGPFGCDFWRGGFNIWKGQISQVKSVKFCIFVTYSFSSFRCYFRFQDIQFLILLQAFSISACMYVISGSSMFYQPPHHQPQRWMRRPLHISTRDKHMIWKLKR